MRVAVILISLFVAASVHAQGISSKKGKVGQFDYEISQIDVAESNGGLAQATVGVKLTNTGKSPVRIAVVRAWPTIQLIDDGTEFQTRYRGINGIAAPATANIKSCRRYSESFTLLRPGQSLEASISLDVKNRKKLLDVRPVKRGRFNATLMVQSLEDETCWLESLSEGQVPVVVNR